MKTKYLFLATLLMAALSVQAQEIVDKELTHYVNVYGRLGYALTFDNMPTYDKDATAPFESAPSSKRLFGGPGAGLGAAYELEYGHFLFNAGLDFTWLNSTSEYALQVNRPLIQPYTMTYQYRFDALRETRNVGYIGVPIMAGAQFNRYFFLVGAKIGYGLMGNYSQKGQYDVTAHDDALIGELGGNQHGFGAYDLESLPAGANKGKLGLNPIDLTVGAEFGIDLDEWLQAPEDRKRGRGDRKAKRYPFTRHNIHYRASIFAEYSVLDGNATAAAPATLAFADQSSVNPTGTASTMALGSALNNLFVGVKFAVQFEIPKKKPIIPPVPPSFLKIRTVDEKTGDAVPNSNLVIYSERTKKAGKPIVMRQGTAQRRVAKGGYQVTATAKNYFPTTVAASIEEAGQSKEVVLSMKPFPVFNIIVTDAETGKYLPITAQVMKRGTADQLYTLTTDSISGAAKAMLAQENEYAVHIALMGYEAFDADIASLDQTMRVQLKPIKKGEVFVIENLFFATNKTRILSTSEEALEALAGYLTRNPEIRIRIIGHTDNVGSDAANQTLSDGRANAVMQDLIARGIAADRLEAVGRGESQPIDTNDTEEGRQNNRRVEVEIL